MKNDNLKRNLDRFRNSTYVGEYLKPTAKKLGDSCVIWVKSFNKHDPQTEFFPAALEVLETPASPVGRASALIICGFFTLAVLWASFGKVDLIASATGKVIPTGHTKVIQPLETGVVRSIHAQDGQKVRAGDILIEIDTTVSESEKERLNGELVSAQLDVARLKSALELVDDPSSTFIPPAGASEQQVVTQKSQLVSQVQSIKSKLQSLDQQMSQSEGNRAAVAATIDKLTKSMPMLKERSKVRSYLSNKGYGSKLDKLTAEQDLVEHQQELTVQQGRLVEAEGALASLKDQRMQVEAEYKQKTLDDLSQAEQKSSSLQEQLVQATRKYQLQTMKAPVDGTIQQLAIHTEGGVVTPAQALLSIVPSDSHLEIEAMVSNKDIGFVHEGQEVSVKVDTFNFTKYGFIHGKVSSVSHDSIPRQKPVSSSPSINNNGQQTSEPDGQELVYAARVSLDQDQMTIDGLNQRLTPGMAVTAEIKTGTQRIIEYLLSPIYRTANQAIHER